MEAKRKLTALLFADVVGYSRLVGADEAGAVARVRRFRQEVLEPALAKRSGRLVKSMGDGFMAEFASVVDAARVATDLQEELAASKDPDGLRLRIGVHMGEVIIDGDDLLGDGVNIAARLQAFAEPGSICLSADAYRQIDGKLPVQFRDAGEQQFKNIERPVRVYALAVPSAKKPASLGPPLPDKPSIAVLPFTNMSGDAEQEYFADGMVEDIITALSRMRWLFVIARNSSFTYKGRPVDVKQVCRELGVRYVLEGSVRKAGNKLRITGELIDAAAGARLWAEKFDGDLENVFDLQDQVTESVVGAIEPKLRIAELRRSRLKPTENLDAYDLYLRALSDLWCFTREGNLNAQQLLEQATDLDPEFALPYALAAFLCAHRTWQGWSENRRRDEEEGGRLARIALEKGRDDPGVLWRCANALAQAGEDIGACAALTERSINLDPNSAEGVAQSGWLQIYVGGYETALQRFARAKRLSPVDPMSFQFDCGLSGAYMFMEQFEDAIRFGHESLIVNPRFTATYRFLAASYALSERKAEAKEIVRQLLRVDPNSGIASMATSIKKTPKIEIYVRGLRLAGLPE